MDIPPEQTKTSVTRLAGLFCLFFLIACGLGYPVLNRYDPRQVPALADVQSYAALVTGTLGPQAGHLRFRRLVPWVARPFYRMAQTRSGSWDPVMFGLLVADSLFVAATALLILVLGTRSLPGYATSLVASFLYLLNFAVPNLRLAGLVDAGEGFFLLALLWAMSELHLWWLPVLALFGALTKESFVPLGIVFTAAWWIVMRHQMKSPAQSAIWIASSWAISLLTTVVLQRWIAGHWINPIDFATSLHENHEYPSHFLSSLLDRNFWYVFLWLLPLGIPSLKQFPHSWLVPTAAASLMVFILDGYYGGAPGTIGRALFSVSGPLLTLSAAAFLVGEPSSVRAEKTR